MFVYCPLHFNAQGLLKEMIQASSSTVELRSNEIASDIAHQLRELQSRMMEVIEHAVIHNPEVS